MTWPLPTAILDVLPQAVSVIDAGGRLAYANPAFWQGLGVEATICPVGSPLRDLVRLAAYRGFYGGGDPEALVEEVMGIDRSRPIRRQIGRADGSRSFETASIPLPGGGFVNVGHDITALLRGRDDQAARARLLEGTLARLHGGVARFGQDMRVALFNTAYESLLGLPGGSLRQGLTHRDIIARMVDLGEFAPGEEAEAVATRMEADRTRPQTRVRQRGSGEVLRFDSQPMPDGGFLLELTDITALKRAEDEARRRAGLLDGVLGALPQGVCVFGPDRRVAMFNAAYVRLLEGKGAVIGESVDEVVQRRLAKGEFDAETAAGILARFAPGARDVSPMLRARPNGTVLENSVARLPDGGVISVFTDVTELHRAREAARDRAAMLDAVLDALPDGVVVYDAERRARITNTAYRRMMGDAAVQLGETLEELADRRVAAGEQTRAAADALLARHLGPAEATGVPIRRVRPDGTAMVSRAGRLPDGGHIAVLTDVTALHRAEEELRRRNAMLEAIFGAVRHGLALYDRHHRLVATNAAIEAVTGIPLSACTPGRPYAEILQEQVRRGVLTQDDVAAVLRIDRSRPRRDTVHRPDGQIVEVMSDPTADGGFVITYTDVTALRRAEEESRHRAAMVEASLGAMRHGIAIFDRDQRLLAANDRMAALTGVPEGRLLPGRTLAELAADQVRAGDLPPEELPRALSLDRARQHRYVRHRHDGRVLEILSDPTPDGGFVVTFTDLTALYRAEEELRQRSAMQAAMLGIIRHGVILYGPDRRVRATNAKTAELTGQPPDSMQPGALMDDLLDAQVARGEMTPAVAERLKSVDRARPHRYERMRPDGHVLEIVSEPTPDGGYALTYSDVTEDRAIRAELERARAAAEAASEAKSRFLATMSHELRTPLNAVIGFSEAIGLERDRARIVEYAAMINEAGRSLLSLVDDILDVARSQTGALQAAQEPFPPGGVMEEAAAAIGAAASAAGLTLVTSVPPALPWLRGDARRLRQVLDKLLSNALKFTPAGGRVTLSAESTRNGLAIRVADTGIGIPPEERERMFEPFTQLDSSLARRFQGSGLGLHLARSLAGALGGTLELADAEGPGLVAVLRFPPDRLAFPATPAGAAVPTL